MGHLRDRMSEDLRLAGFSPSTRRIYLHYAKSFAARFMRSPEELGEDEVRSFLLYLLDQRKLSHHLIGSLTTEGGVGETGVVFAHIECDQILDRVDGVERI